MFTAIRRSVVACAALLLTSTVPALGQDQTEGQTFGDWQIRCDPIEGGEQCALSQWVQAENLEGVDLRAFFFRPPENPDALLLSVLVPLNVILTKRLGLRIDSGELMMFDYIRCSDAGCLVSIAIDDSLLASFQAGVQALFVIYFEDETGIGIPVSLDGLTSGLEALAQG